ncbi:MAG: hypothetical protein NTV80_20600, partial [Verrucomicrobia bacterium]|nr:hypothetical protein [Verrucomicrobiota bacterium]
KRIRKDLETKAASNQNQYRQLIQPDPLAAKLTNYDNSILILRCSAKSCRGFWTADGLPIYHPHESGVRFMLKDGLKHR